MRHSTATASPRCRVFEGSDPAREQRIGSGQTRASGSSISRQSPRVTAPEHDGIVESPTMTGDPPWRSPIAKISAPSSREAWLPSASLKSSRRFGWTPIRASTVAGITAKMAPESTTHSTTADRVRSAGLATRTGSVVMPMGIPICGSARVVNRCGASSRQRLPVAWTRRQWSPRAPPAAAPAHRAASGVWRSRR